MGNMSATGSADVKLDHLFALGKIGTMSLANRLVVPAMVTNFCTEDGFATERYIRYHEAKAKGGWGLIITEDYPVDIHGRGYTNVAGLWKDEQVESHRQLTDRVHQYDSKIVAQVYHAGRQAKAVVAGAQPVAPSAIPCPWMRDLPRELTTAEIKTIISQFGDTARRVKQAGFDGIEIHGGHGYLIAEFMSPYTNKRTDAYGGCFEKRMRFVHEIIDVVRDAVGPDFPILFRFSADEVQPGGRDMAESRMVARLMEAWGVDALHVSTGVYGNYGIVSPMVIPHAWTVDFAEEIKRLVKLPVITVNRINDPLMADTLLQMGKADFVAMGRGSLADPDLPNKARDGRRESIRYCIGCMEGCTGSLRGVAGEGAICCAVNPELGREWNVDLTPAPKRKKVLIAGGGPAGMDAARAAAQKGHVVVLYEKRSFLGGQFKSAAYPPYKGELASFTAWQIAQLEDNHNVTIHLGTALTAEIARQEKADVLIVATGATAIRPNIPGGDRPKVVMAEDVLLGNVPTGDVCFVCGGGSVGVEVASHLSIQLKKVTIADLLPEFFPKEDPDIRSGFLNLMDQNKIQQITGAKIVEFAERGVLLEKDGSIVLHPCDTIVLAFGSRKNNALVEELQGCAAKIVTVGDAGGVALLLQATATGFEAGLTA